LPANSGISGGWKNCFLGIKYAKEEPYDYVEGFITSCLGNGRLKPENEEEWKKTMIIVCFEMYANMPVFEYETNNLSSM